MWILGSWMTTCLGKSCSFGLPRVPFVNYRQFMYLVISLLVLRAGCGIWLYQCLIIAYLFTLENHKVICTKVSKCQFPLRMPLSFYVLSDRNMLQRQSSIEMSHLMTKPTKWSVRPAKTQISLSIRPVWSESSICAHWVAKYPSFLDADSEDSDQTGRMPMLIWVFARRTCHFVGFILRRLK